MSAPDPSAYPATLIRQGDTWHLVQQELGILLRGADPGSLLAQCEQQAADKLAHFAQLQLAPPPPPAAPRPGGSLLERRLSPGMRRFLKQLVLVLVLAIFLGAAIRDAARITLLQLPAASGKAIGAAVGQLDALITQLAALPPERQEAVAAKLRRGLTALSPVTRTLREALVAECPGPAPDPMPAGPR
ncbi:MAG: hypothetical protein HQL82_12890 [Magnetococcales bacterium]|nr:hypothetical protein [Magnetococcales bacterium]